MKTTTDEPEQKPVPTKEKDNSWMYLLGLLLLALAAYGIIAYKRNKKPSDTPEEQWNKLSSEEQQEFLDQMKADEDNNGN